jgi:hypothetical protein
VRQQVQVFTVLSLTLSPFLDLNQGTILLTRVLCLYPLSYHQDFTLVPAITQ